MFDYNDRFGNARRRAPLNYLSPVEVETKGILAELEV